MIDFIEPSVKLLSITPWSQELIEIAGRTCYDSVDKITHDSADKFVKKLVKAGHESVIEHGTATFEIVCSRSTSHQIVRHRLFSYSQRSQRYVNETDFKCIMPNVFDANQQVMMRDHMQLVQNEYMKLINQGVRREDARSILPNACATTIVMTGNFRNWRHFIRMRGSNAAQSEIRSIAGHVLDVLSSYACFEDLKEINNVSH